MAKAKKPKPVALKTKPAKPSKPPRAPMDPELKRRIRRITLHTLGVLFLIGGLFGGVALVRGHVEREIAFPAEPPQVVLKQRPVWMSDFLYNQIARSVRPAGAHSAFDHEILVNIDTKLRANPWIKQVRQIRRMYAQRPGDTIEIDCEFRAPVALVHWGEYYWLVDGEGVKLPEQYTAQQVPHIIRGPNRKMNIRLVEGVAHPPPESGQQWIGKDLAAGLAMVKLLFDEPYTEEIVKVDVANFDGRQDPRAAQLVLVTRYGTDIRWGQPINAKDFFLEVPVQRKLEYLASVYREKLRVDGGHSWLDIRYDAITYPATEARADMAP